MRLACAERLAAPIVKALLGKAAVPDDCPYTTGGIGLLGTKPSQEALEDCDTLLIAGTSFPYIEFYPKPNQARAIQIDIDPARIGLRYPVELGIVADCRKTLQMLAPKLKPNKHRDFLKRAQMNMEEWRELMEERGTRTDKPMKPQVVSWNLGQLLTVQRRRDFDLTGGANRRRCHHYGRFRHGNHLGCAHEIAGAAAVFV